MSTTAFLKFTRNEDTRHPCEGLVRPYKGGSALRQIKWALQSLHVLRTILSESAEMISSDSLYSWNAKTDLHSAQAYYHCLGKKYERKNNLITLNTYEDRYLASAELKLQGDTYDNMHCHQREEGS